MNEENEVLIEILRKILLIYLILVKIVSGVV